MKKLLITFAALMFGSCSSFSEVEANIIQDQKIRSFGIQLSQSEAVPGDTINLDLLLDDAGKNYEVKWELGLNYYMDNYAQKPVVRNVVDLDSMALDVSTDGKKLTFVMPDDKNNPLLLTRILGNTFLEASQIPEEYKSSLGQAMDLSDGLQKSEMVDLLSSMESIPNEMSPLVDNFYALVQIRAIVTSGKFRLDVVKNITVRYSKNLATGELISNYNQNPDIKRIAVIDVQTKDLDDYRDISKYKSDTTWLTALALDDNSVVDTIKIHEDHSYFLLADKEDQDTYRSPSQKEHVEEDFYDWYYSNLDDVGDKWEDQVEIDFYFSHNTNDSIAILRTPKIKEMKNARFYVTLRDGRPEWMMGHSQGVDILQSNVFFDYQ